MVVVNLADYSSSSYNATIAINIILNYQLNTTNFLIHNINPSIPINFFYKCEIYRIFDQSFNVMFFGFWRRLLVFDCSIPDYHQIL